MSNVFACAKGLKILEDYQQKSLKNASESGGLNNLHTFDYCKIPGKVFIKTDDFPQNLWNVALKFFIAFCEINIWNILGLCQISSTEPSTRRAPCLKDLDHCENYQPYWKVSNVLRPDSGNSLESTDEWSALVFSHSSSRFPIEEM